MHKLSVLILSAGVLLLALALAAGVGLAAPVGPGDAPNAPQTPEAVIQAFLPLLVMGRDNLPVGADGLEVTHAGDTFIYENGATCAACHAAQADDMLHANHYRWQGKLGSINDFCGYPDINFIGIMTNLNGEKVNGGCAGCHAGMGAKPDTAGVENVDCLMCHAPDYQRVVTDVGGGTLRFVPVPGVTSVVSPGRAECLRCHIGAGGGPNNKRGDLEPAHVNPPSADFDVHMASTDKGGAGLVCIDCHTTQDHEIAGRGADLRISEGSGMKRCADCHTSSPHDSSRLNRHTEKVACESCHIPAFARIQSTDMYRDFRETEVDHLKNLYEPKLTRQDNVVPAYAFWNGNTEFYQFGSPASNGQALARPGGGIDDAISKLFPFKLHHAMQAHNPLTDMLLPLKMGILFQSGDVDKAVTVAASDLGIDLSQGYDFIETQRYMGIYHEVAPSENALDCADCHDNGDQRIDFEALGYTPRETRNGEPLCQSCHGREDTPSFYKLHDEHAREENIACIVCHTFSR